jgi:hypothetical protein
MILFCVLWTETADLLMASKDPKMRKEGASGNRKHVTLIIFQKPVTIGRLESGKISSVMTDKCTFADG